MFRAVVVRVDTTPVATPFIADAVIACRFVDVRPFNSVELRPDVCLLVIAPSCVVVRALAVVVVRPPICVLESLDALNAFSAVVEMVVSCVVVSDAT